MKKLTALMILLMLLTMVGCAANNKDIPHYSTKKASDDFTDLFALTDTHADALAAVTVTDIQQVDDIVEKYAVHDTSYTKITATVDREFTKRIQTDSITILILGTNEGFPNREQMVKGRSYLLRLESWVHQDGIIWLISPLESTYLRIFDNEILVHESADDLNYKRASSPDEFAKKYADYQQTNPPAQDALLRHYDDIRKCLDEYDYQNAELTYKLTQEEIASRKALAEKLK